MNIEIKCHNCYGNFLIKKKNHAFLLKRKSSSKFFCSRSCSAKFRNSIRPLVPTPEGRAKATESYVATCAKRPPSYLRCLVSFAQKRALKFNREFSITVQDISRILESQEGKCAYTKVALDTKPYKTGHPLTKDAKLCRASIDRIDSSKGYTPENVQLVCSKVNSMKMDLPHMEFIKMCKAIAQNF